MKKVFIKGIAFVTALMIAMTNTGVIDAQAKISLYQQAQGSSTFKKAWEKVTYMYLSNGTLIGKLVWGFDTVWIDEDYAKGKSCEAYATTSIKRVGYDSSFVKGDGRKGVGIYSETRKWHLKNNVEYCLELSPSYSIFDVYCKTVTN